MPLGFSDPFQHTGRTNLSLPDEKLVLFGHKHIGALRTVFSTTPSPPKTEKTVPNEDREVTFTKSPAAFALYNLAVQSCVRGLFLN